MSNRETQLAISLQQWRGVDQRTSPTLVQEGFFVFSRGVYYGLGDNAERVPGKTLSVKLPNSILHIFQFGSQAIVQSFGQVDIVDIAELAGRDVVYAPDAPVAPTLSNVAYTTIDIETPATYPSHTLSFSIQRSLDNINWTTVATGFATLQTLHDSGLNDSTLYYYRLLAVGSGTNNTTSGSSANATTLDATVQVGAVNVTVGGIVVKIS